MSSKFVFTVSARLARGRWTIKGTKGIEPGSWSNARREVGRDERDGVQKSEVGDQRSDY